MTVKTAIDIEDLVRWTYQVQRADLIIGSGVGLYEGEAHVDRVGGRGRGDSCAKVRRAALLGVRVDESGGGGALHPDAEAVHMAVIGLTTDDRSAGLDVLQFGLAGLRPDWREGAKPRWEPCFTQLRDGRAVPVYQYNDNVGIGKRPWFCPMRMVDDPVSVAYARRVYAAWHGGLVHLSRVFTANRARLSVHTVTGPAAPGAPWKAHNSAV